MRTFRLSQNEVDAVQRTGVTFSPRTCGVVCNQFPRFGLLSKRQADTIRAQVWPRTHTNKAKKEPRVPERLRQVHKDGLGGTTCPHCRTYNAVATEGLNRCVQCHGTFQANPMSTQGRRYYYGSWMDARPLW